MRGTPSVLVVDDDNAMQEMLVSLLEEEGLRADAVARSVECDGFVAFRGRL